MKIIDYFLYNFLIGNADAHAKNFSIVEIGGERSIAPIYDAMSTAVYPNVVNSMAMNIGGKYEYPEVTRNDFVDLAMKCDISIKAILSRLDALAAELPRIGRDLVAEMSDEGHPSKVYDEILGVVNRHIEQTKA